ncbi:MAG: ferritin family protein [Planctomycetota bacterium]|jgi:rubrerythrin
MADFVPNEEILELAITREEIANRLFLELAARARNPEIRKVFEELADEELEHKAKLELEIMKTGKVMKESQKPLFRERIDKGEPDSWVDMDYKDMLLLGIQKEDAAFRFYVKLAANARDEDSYETLMALAEQEIKHKLRFEMEYEKLLKTK